MVSFNSLIATAFSCSCLERLASRWIQGEVHGRGRESFNQCYPPRVVSQREYSRDSSPFTGQNTSSSPHLPTIREQVDTIVSDFRFLPAPASDETQAVLGGGSPRRCKDARRQLRVAQGYISNEHEFNEFLTSNPHRTRTSNIAMIRSYLQDDHKVFLAHGDLHPRNIMVVTRLHDPVVDDAPPKESLCTINGIVSQSTTQFTITAILDWEMCGWYPEYWEYVKALNTITPSSEMDDWWAYLPWTVGV
jgi:hypothetical protein